MKIVLCIEKLTIGGFTFREGEAYLANMVNEHYWVVESIGVSDEDFPMHFEIQEELVKVKASEEVEDTATKRFLAEEMEFKKFLENFGFEEKEDKDEDNKETWYSRLRDYILV